MMAYDTVSGSLQHFALGWKSNPLRKIEEYREQMAKAICSLIRAWDNLPFVHR